MTLLLLIPFLSKPFYADDPVYLAVARQVLRHPFDPFGFPFNWYGIPAPMWEQMNNPPGLGYLLAPLIRIFGEREIPLHTIFLVFPVTAVLAAYDIARRFSPAPFAPALLLAAAPLVTVAATSIMADVPALALTLGAIALLLSAIEGRPWRGFLGGLSAAGAVLIKYNAIHVIPLLALGALLFDRRPWRHAAAVLIPLLALGAWEWLNVATHAGSHLLHATGAIREQRLPAQTMIVGVATFLFLGAGSAPVLFAARVRRLDTWFFLLPALVLGAVLVWLFRVPYYRLGIEGAVPVVTWIVTAAGLSWIAMTGRCALTRRREDLFLLAWLGGTIFQAIALSYFVAARFVLPALFPALILASRNISRVPSRVVHVAAPVAAALSLLVATADLDLARVYRDAATALHARYGHLGPHLRFQGHGSFQYFMEQRGHRILDERTFDLRPGELLVTPRWLFGIHFRFHAGASPAGVRVVPEDILAFSGRAPATVMNRDTGAGFHNIHWGPLPFSWRADPIEQFEIVRIVGGPTHAP